MVSDKFALFTTELRALNLNDLEVFLLMVISYIFNFVNGFSYSRLIFFNINELIIFTSDLIYSWNIFWINNE